MKKIIEYKGYKGTLKYSKEDQYYHGLIQDVRATCMYDGETEDECIKDFEGMVDFYIQYLEDEAIPK